MILIIKKSDEILPEISVFLGLGNQDKLFRIRCKQMKYRLTDGFCSGLSIMSK